MKVRENDSRHVVRQKSRLMAMTAKKNTLSQPTKVEHLPNQFPYGSTSPRRSVLCLYRVILQPRAEQRNALTNSVTLSRFVPSYRSPTVLSGSKVSNTVSEHEQGEHSRLYSCRAPVHLNSLQRERKTRWSFDAGYVRHLALITNKMLLAPANVARNVEINQTDIELNSISSEILERLVYLIYEFLGDIYHGAFIRRIFARSSIKRTYIEVKI